MKPARRVGPLAPVVIMSTQATSNPQQAIREVAATAVVGRIASGAHRHAYRIGQYCRCFTASSHTAKPLDELATRVAGPTRLSGFDDEVGVVSTRHRGRMRIWGRHWIRVDVDC